MNCNKCGARLTGEEDYCPNCGNPVIVTSSNTPTMVDLMAQASQKKWALITNKIKSCFNQHRKAIIIGSSLCLVVIVSLILFNFLYDFTKLNWDPKVKDNSITYTLSTTTLELKVLAFDKKKKPITKIKFTADAGKINVDGLKVKWKLPNEEGSYTIIAQAPSGKKIKKTIEVVDLDLGKKELRGMITAAIDDQTADNDNDGLTNAEEKKLKTNINSADTDCDGLTDFYEIKVSKTNPLKADCDNDGLTDGNELDNGLNPLKKDSKGDGIIDGQRTLNYLLENSQLGVTATIQGKGNITSSTVDGFKNSTFASMEGVIDRIYNFATPGIINQAVIKIKYDLAEIKAKGLTEANLSLYYFNEKSKKLEIVPTTIDFDAHQLVATVKHFSKYLVGDQTLVQNREVEVLFVIDNSVSMYSEEQLPNSSGAVGNDTDFKRLSLTNQLVDMFTGNYQFGVAEFTGDYLNLHQFSSDTKSVKKAVNSMKNNIRSSGIGTNIIAALKNGVAEFQTKVNNQYLILLTDGQNTEGSLTAKADSIIEKAKTNNVKVCVIGLGEKIDSADLTKIAQATGCDYYNANDTKALDEIYALIGANINYNYVDTTGDGKADGMILANSDFLVNRDGFSFANFSSNKSPGGNCYGMATLTSFYYQKQLPVTLPATTKSILIKLLKKEKLQSNGYDLKGTYFESNQPLGDFKITNPALSLLLNTHPKDYYSEKDGVLLINEEYHKLLTNIDVTFINKKYPGKNKKIKQYQTAQLNIDSDKLKNTVSKNEFEILQAIWRLFILQADDSTVSFNTSPDDAYLTLLTDLENKKPLIIGFDGHAVNGINLIQDLADANKFKIGVYDNNYPGETRYFTMIRSKYNKVQVDVTAWTNEYNYEFEYEGEKVKSIWVSYPVVE